MIRSVYCLHMYYHVRRVLKRLRVPLPHETSFNAADNPYTESEFFKICDDYRVPNDPMKYRDEKFYWSYQHSVHWQDDYLGPDSMTRWIIEASDGFTDVGLLKISESVRAYAYLILSSQASTRSSVVGNMASALTAQSAFLNNFENVVNQRVDIQEDIKRYQDTLSYSSSKVDYSVGEHLYMLPSNMTLKIKTGTVRYNNKILVSDVKFILGKNDEVNASLAKSEEETMTKQTTTIHKVVTKAPQPPAPVEKAISTHEDEKIAFILLLTGGFTYGTCFDEQKILCTTSTQDLMRLML